MIYIISYGIDAHTGANLWKVLNYIYYADTEYNIGIAYRYLNGEGYTNELMGIDLQTSKLVWKRNIDRTYGWNDFFYLNDSTLMVVAAGLHAINIQTGKGWDYNTIAGKVDNSGTTAATVGGIVGGIIGGIIGGLLGGSLYYVPTFNTSMTTGGDIIRDVVSNTLINGNFIYFASHEKFVKIDKETGNMIWESTFRKDVLSKSSIFMEDNDIYMVNHGFAFRGNRQINYGKPFLAAFDMQNGKQKYISLLNNAKDFIIDYKKIGNDIYLLFQHKIAKYDLTTGTKIFEKDFSDETFGELQYFSENQLFVLVKNEFLNLEQYEQPNLHINSQRIILSMDEELNVTNTIRYNHVGNCILNYSDYKFISNENKTFVIHNDGQIIAELEITSKAFIIDDILYDKRDKSFVAIDLKENF
jgi:hypothetical protein